MVSRSWSRCAVARPARLTRIREHNHYCGPHLYPSHPDHRLQDMTLFDPTFVVTVITACHQLLVLSQPICMQGIPILPTANVPEFD